MTLPALKPEHVQWQKQCLDCLTVGGRWCIPATGTIIEKLNNDKVRVVIPGNDEFYLATVIRHIRAAGYEVAGLEGKPIYKEEEHDKPPSGPA